MEDRAGRVLLGLILLVALLSAGLVDLRIDSRIQALLPPDNASVQSKFIKIVPAVVIILFSAFFLIMLTVLYFGHIFMMSYCRKTTQEALKKSEK